jgi:hypothetical protein
MKDTLKYVIKTSFKDEFKNIENYIVKAFNGESEKDIRNCFQEVLEKMMEISEINRYSMVSEHGCLEDKISLGHVMKKNNMLLSYISFVSFSKYDHEEINTIDSLKYWNSTRRLISKIIQNSLPNLVPNHLNELLENQEAVIPEQPKFDGVTLETAGAFPFHKRVNPQSLRYDIQEQGNSWLKVVTGAIVCQYHQFLQIKQDNYITKNLKDLKSRVANNDFDKNINCTDWLINKYQESSNIIQ